MKYRGVAEDIRELANLVAVGYEFDILVGSFIDFNKNLVKKGRIEEARTSFLPAPRALTGLVPEGDVFDGFLAAMTEKLHEDWSLGEPPSWVNEEWRCLSEPHYTIQTKNQAFIEKLHRISPPAFKKRNLFYTERVLDRC